MSDEDTLRKIYQQQQTAGRASLERNFRTKLERELPPELRSALGLTISGVEAMFSLKGQKVTISWFTFTRPAEVHSYYPYYIKEFTREGWEVKSDLPGLTFTVFDLGNLQGTLLDRLAAGGYI